MRKQVSRLCFILLGRLPAGKQWLLCPFVRFTVTGVARKFHPNSLGRCSPAGALIGRKCARYSFNHSIDCICENVNFLILRVSGNFSFCKQFTRKFRLEGSMELLIFKSL